MKLILVGMRDSVPTTSQLRIKRAQGVSAQLHEPDLPSDENVPLCHYRFPVFLAMEVFFG